MSDEKKGVSVTVIKADDTAVEPVIKAESSVQIDEDEKRYANDWPEPELPLDGQIGRASCRERVYVSV